MSARDLAAELEADRARQELAALRLLRDSTLALGMLLERSERCEELSKTDGEQLDVSFDRDGMGPFVVPSPKVTWRLVELARDAFEVTGGER